MDENTRAAIAALLHPHAIAIVGASSRRESLGGRPLEILKQRAVEGQIFPVHPSATAISGIAAAKSIRDVEAKIDVAAILVGPSQVPAVLNECGEAGVGTAYIFTSGFGETTNRIGAEFERELSAVCARWPTRVAGPNGEGMYNVSEDIAITFSPVADYERGLQERPQPGNVAIIAQSGGIAFGIFSQGMARGVRFNYVLSTGNEIDLELLDYLEYLVDDHSTKVIAVFVEGFKDPRRFREIASLALRLGKFIVVMKVGRSEAGQKAALSHTGHLSGRSELYSSLFRHHGVVEVTDMDELLDVLAVLSTDAVPTGRNVGIFTSSGGAGAWLADALEDHAMSVPELSTVEQGEIAALLPYYANAVNPIDYTGGTEDPKDVQRALAILSASSSMDLVVVVMSLLIPTTVKERIVTIAATVREAGKPLIVCSYTEPAPSSIKILADAGIPWFTSQRGLARTLSLVSSAQEDRSVARHVEHEHAVQSWPDPDGSHAPLSEHAVKSWLRSEGFPVPAGAVAQSLDEAVSSADSLGYPVAVKLQSAVAHHKTEIGAVMLNVRTPEELHEAWARVTRHVGGQVPVDKFEGVLIEQMSSPGLEMMVGLISDPDLGRFVLVGSGGTTAELDRDVEILPAPVTVAEALGAIERLACAPLLSGWRGAQERDVEALAETVSRISRITFEGARAISELDLNPVIVHGAGEGVDIVDAFALVQVDSHV